MFWLHFHGIPMNSCKLRLMQIYLQLNSDSRWRRCFKTFCNFEIQQGDVSMWSTDFGISDWASVAFKVKSLVSIWASYLNVSRVHDPNFESSANIWTISITKKCSNFRKLILLFLYGFFIYELVICNQVLKFIPDSISKMLKGSAK